MTTGQIVGTPSALRNVLGGREVGLVPTMGSLHAGHLAIIERAADENEVAAISIFVNPTQFKNPADLAAYPRDLEDDAARAIAAGARVIYTPSVETIYPPGFASSVSVSGLTERWEGEFRPGHFAGVATVVSILLNTFKPARPYFGEKDFQQLAMIRRMHADLELPGEIVGCPTVRDVDGLALSSRNARLSDADRSAAAAIPQALFALQASCAAGETDSTALVHRGLDILATQPGVSVDYLAIVDSETLEPVSIAKPGCRLLVAASVGGVRLIDNVELGGETGDIS